MNKIIFNYCKKHLRLIEHGEFKVNASLKHLANHYNIGYIESGRYYFKPQDKLQLVEVIAQELDGIRLSDAYPEAQTRLQRASDNSDEKNRALKVSEDFVLVNSLNGLHLNQQSMANCTINSLGNFLCASEIKSIQHTHLVLVENLTVMANLNQLNIPAELQEALWLYRGDAQLHKHTSTANRFFRRFEKTHVLICFSDFDPAGLQIALTCGAQQWLTIEQKESIKVKLNGFEGEWFKQNNQRNFLIGKASLNNKLDEFFSIMNDHQKTIKQEHMLAHHMKLGMLPLSLGSRSTCDDEQL